MLTSQTPSCRAPRSPPSADGPAVSARAPTHGGRTMRTGTSTRPGPQRLSSSSSIQWSRRASTTAADGRDEQQERRLSNVSQKKRVSNRLPMYAGVPYACGPRVAGDPSAIARGGAQSAISSSTSKRAGAMPPAREQLRADRPPVERSRSPIGSQVADYATE